LNPVCGIADSIASLDPSQKDAQDDRSAGFAAQDDNA
jgi:hypothetical protein